jgi:hypothetical protein
LERVTCFWHPTATLQIVVLSNLMFNPSTLPRSPCSAVDAPGHSKVIQFIDVFDCGALILKCPEKLLWGALSYLLAGS